VVLCNKHKGCALQYRLCILRDVWRHIAGQFIKSIRDIGTASQPVWGLPAGNLGGKNVTLDDVEVSTAV